MGFVVPPFNLDPRQYDKIYETIAQIMNEKFPAEKRVELTYRPIRPDEINAAFTVATRLYASGPLAAANTYERILGAAADAVVRTGSVYVIFGWIFIDDPTGTAPAGLDAVGQVVVEGTVKNEVSLAAIQANTENCILTWDQIVVMGEQTTFAIQWKGAKGGVALVYPLGFRIGPKSQLDQG